MSGVILRFTLQVLTDVHEGNLLRENTGGGKSGCKGTEAPARLQWEVKYVLFAVGPHVRQGELS